VYGKPQLYQGAIAVVSADNLGSLALGGFKESCTAKRCCRHCLATRETTKLKVTPFRAHYEHVIYTHITLTVFRE